MYTMVHPVDTSLRFRIQSIRNGEEYTYYDDKADSCDRTGLCKDENHTNDNDSNPQ